MFYYASSYLIKNLAIQNFIFTSYFWYLLELMTYLYLLTFIDMSLIYVYYLMTSCRHSLVSLIRSLWFSRSSTVDFSIGLHIWNNCYIINFNLKEFQFISPSLLCVYVYFGEQTQRVFFRYRLVSILISTFQRGTPSEGNFFFRHSCKF